MKKYLFLLAFLFACSDKENEVYVHYRGDFDSSNVKIVEEIVKKFSQKWGLSIWEKNKSDMSRLTNHQESFFMGLEINSNTIMTINNVGIGNVISIIVIKNSYVSSEKLDFLSSNILKDLENINIKMNKVK